MKLSARYDSVSAKIREHDIICWMAPYCPVTCTKYSTCIMKMFYVVTAIVFNKHEDTVYMLLQCTVRHDIGQLHRSMFTSSIDEKHESTVTLYSVVQ